MIWRIAPVFLAATSTMGLAQAADCEMKLPGGGTMDCFQVQSDSIVKNSKSSGKFELTLRKASPELIRKIHDILVRERQ